MNALTYGKYSEYKVHLCSHTWSFGLFPMTLFSQRNIEDLVWNLKDLCQIQDVYHDVRHVRGSCEISEEISPKRRERDELVHNFRY